MNRKASKSIKVLLLLAASIVAAGTFLGGLLTGKVDGLAKGGNDLVVYTDNPLLFSLLLLFYLGLAIAFAFLAFREALRKTAP